MSFQFKRRGDVREQSPQQEPFFQTNAQSPYAEQGMYPQMGQPGQGYGQGAPHGHDPRFSTNQMPSPQPFLQNNPGNFYGPQGQMAQPGYQGAQQQFNFGHPPQMQAPMPGQAIPQPVMQESYLHAIQASQLNAQRTNFQGNNYQNPGFNPALQGYGTQPNQQFIPEEPRQSNNPNGINPMAFWHEPQPAPNYDDTEGDTANSPIKLLVAVAGVALIGAFSWFAYKWAKAPSSDTVPLIHAEPGPHKVSPDHRGGINIPYQDKLIYNRIGDGNTNDPAERLLPPPEQPTMMQNQNVQHPQQGEMNQNQQQPTYSEAPMAQNGMQQPQPQITQAQQTMQAPQQQVAQTTTEPSNTTKRTADEETDEDSEPVIKKNKATETISGNFFVQLATVKSEEAAIREWKRLAAKHNLKGLKSQIKEFERDDGEVVYRLLMGPFTDKVKALKYAVKIDGTKVVQVTQ